MEDGNNDVYINIHKCNYQSLLCYISILYLIFYILFYVINIEITRVYYNYQDVTDILKF